MNSKNSLIKNSIYNVLYRCLGIVFPLISSIYVARILTPSYVGKVSVAQNFVSYFTIFTSMGIPTYGVKLIAQFTGKKECTNSAFWELWIINFFLSGITGIMYYLTVALMPFFYEERTLYAVSGLVLVINIINIDWFFQGIQEYKYIAIRSLIIKIISLILLFSFVHDKNDYLIYAIINIIALTGNYLFNIFTIRKYIKVSIKRLQFKEHLVHIFSLFGASLAAEIYTLTDTTMLNIMSGSKIVGYYSISMNVVRILRGLVVAIAAVFLPQLSYYYHNKKNDMFCILVDKGLHVLVLLTIPVAIGLMLVADDLILLFFGKEYIGSILSTQILAISVMSVALSNFIGLQILVTLGKEKITTFSTIIGAGVNIVLNICLIVRYQHIGAAIASAITEMTVTLFQYIFCRKYIEIKMRLIGPVIASLIMSIVVLLIKFLGIPIFLRLFLECFLGCITYFIIIYILKDEMIVDIITRVKEYMNRMKKLK